MADPVFDHVYRYAAASALDAQPGRAALRLATSGGQSPHPFFFEGSLLSPRLTAQLLTALSHVVGSRFAIHPTMLARLVALADPIVTSGGGMLRFEGFSGCGSAHARVDATPAAYAGDLARTGTTNVDFNAPMRAALAQIRDGDAVTLSVGSRALALTRGGETTVERKVALPSRWLRGLVEVQAYAAAMTRRLTVSGVAASRFLRALPRAKTHKHPSWIAPAGADLRWTQREQAGAVRIAGTERLRVLEGLAPYAQRLAVYADDAGEASAWELDFGALRFVLTLSADVWRGFSGEGQALLALAKAGRSPAVARARASLRWQAHLRAASLGQELGLAEGAVTEALAVLGAQGLVGYDLADGTYFHRELPFDALGGEVRHPRLVAARRLAEGGHVALGAGGDAGADVVKSGGVEHAVRGAPGGARCTCPWFAKYAGRRGPCKHALAVLLARAEAS